MSELHHDADVGPARGGPGVASPQQQPYPQGYQQGYQQTQAYQQPQGYAPYGYGHQQYGHQQYGYQRPFGAFRQQFPTETKPFFLTSEFALIVLTVIGLAITAATSSTVDARYFWAATTALVIGYVISRGIAKSGSKSHATDPRDQLDLANRFGGGDNDNH
jgi:hypothetical protein